MLNIIVTLYDFSSTMKYLVIKNGGVHCCSECVRIIERLGLEATSRIIKAKQTGKDNTIPHACLHYPMGRKKIQGKHVKKGKQGIPKSVVFQQEAV